jgi:hypothetical protein
MVGYDPTDNENTQISNATIAQQYSGTCQIRCDNIISGSSVNVINSQVGGDVGIEQVCSVNGQCMFNNNQQALADIFFKAANSANSQANSGLWNGTIFQWGPATNKSYQSIAETISQNINQECDVSSVNDINNSNVYAINSQIGGKVVIGQNGAASGNCTLQSGMNATAIATGLSDQCASAGKKAKKTCGGKSMGIGSYILYGILGIVAFTVIMLIVRYFRKEPDCTPDLIKKGVKCKPVASKVQAPAAPAQNLPGLGSDDDYNWDDTKGGFNV